MKFSLPARVTWASLGAGLIACADIVVQNRDLFSSLPLPAKISSCLVPAALIVNAMGHSITPKLAPPQPPSQKLP
ncbi:MAG: hypothetical protein NVS2B17_29220 [Candidatus Velthaea sp.]